MPKQRWPLGLAEMATMFGVDVGTTTKWQYRSRRGRMHPPLPEPDGYVSGSPFWWDVTLRRWGAASGRRVLRIPVGGRLVDLPAASGNGSAPARRADRGEAEEPAAGDRAGGNGHRPGIPGVVFLDPAPTRTGRG
jgi:hypothetical protein